MHGNKEIGQKCGISGCLIGGSIGKSPRWRLFREHLFFCCDFFDPGDEVAGRIAGAFCHGVLLVPDGREEDVLHVFSLLQAEVKVELGIESRSEEHTSELQSH